MTTDKKIALITGANRGIGLALTRLLAREGFGVLLSSRSQQARTVVDKLQQEGLDVHYLALDVNEPECVKAAVQEVEHTYGRLDVLINNAGVCLDEHIPFKEIDTTVLERTMRTNFFGPFYVIRAFLPLMELHQYGRIINISSSYGAMNEMSDAGTGAYKLSKLALNGMTQLFAAEVTGDIKINAICPGWVKTDMGGPHATREVEDAAKSILWLATLDQDGPTGGFFRNDKSIPW